MKYRPLTLILLTLLVFTSVCKSVYAQYSLDMAIEDLKSNTSLFNLYDLIKEESQYDIDNIGKRKLPQPVLTSQATFQSETTKIEFDFPGFDPNFPSLDQYQIRGEVNQLIYDGGNTALLQNLRNTSARLEQNSVSLEIDALIEQCISTFFNIKELELRINQFSFLLAEIDISLKKLQAGVFNGTVLQSDLNTLQVERYQVVQQQNELEARLKAHREILKILTDHEGALDEILIVPEDSDYRYDINPSNIMMQSFDTQKESLDWQFQLEDLKKKPQLGAFAQLGYGKPGLNFLKNGFHSYYLVGLRLHWNLSSFYSSKNNRQIYTLNNLQIDNRKEAYETGISIKNTRLQNELDHLREAIAADAEIISLRKQIKEIADIQLENGTITTTEYLIKLNDVNRAVLLNELRNIQTHKIKYLIDFNNGWLN